MPGATAPFVGGWKFFVSCSSWECVFRLETFDDVDNTAPSHKFSDGGPDSPQLAWHHREIFSGFIIIPFIVGFLKTVYTGSRADLTIHISGAVLVAWQSKKRCGTRSSSVLSPRVRDRAWRHAPRPGREENRCGTTITPTPLLLLRRR